VALVTGGGRGIGRAISLALAGAGAWVAPVARNAGDLALVGIDIAKAGGRAPKNPMAGDVRRPEDMEKIVERITAEAGPPDIVVIAAGIARYTPVAELRLEEWQEHLDTNLTGAFVTVRACLAGMLARRMGDVVTIGSVASIKAFPGCGAYSASKFGLLGFTRVLREEVRSQGVRVTAILPGATDTAIWGDPPPVPPERMMPAESVARAVLMAVTASDRAVVEEILLRPALGDL
jgi:NAD(P)-dependent dehydrogenase (short-subunit alcohol dehydrogenase family)